MHIICKDGTTIKCRNFEAVDSGVLFFQETPTRREATEEDEEEDERERASGFIPITELRFVLPDEMVQQQAREQQAGHPQQAQAGQLPTGVPQQGGQASQYQQMQGSPGTGPGGQTGPGRQ